MGVGVMERIQGGEHQAWRNSQWMPAQSAGEAVEPGEGQGMTRAQILDTAKEYVTRDRAAEHGDAERNFETIAAYWSTHLGVSVAAHDVAVMMTMLKLARIKSNPANEDNWTDGAGYLACGGEIATGGGN